VTTTDSLDIAEHLARLLDEVLVPAAALWIGAMVRRYLKLPPKDKE
jgi:hypothetical protein